MPRPWAPSAPGRSRSPAWAPIHKILGVERNADDKAIKTAYRRMARKHHPDVSKGSAARFQEINEAYEVLSDPAKRNRYDTLGPDWHRSAETGAGAGSPAEGAEVHFRQGGDPRGVSDFFRTIFGDLGRGGGRVRDTRRGGLGDLEFTDLGDLGGDLEAERGGDAEAAIDLSLEEAFQSQGRDDL